MDFICDPWIIDLSFSRWLTFISIETLDSMRISNMLLQDSRQRNLEVVLRVFGDILGRRVLSLAWPIHTSHDIKV